MGNLFAQASVRLARDAAFLKDPGGVHLGSLASGIRLTPGKASGGHVEVALRGWIFTTSLRPDKREGFDVSVRLPNGENLRAEPDGAVLGRAVEGALFNRVSVRGGWTQVRRSAWVERGAFPAAKAAASPKPAPHPGTVAAPPKEQPLAKTAPPPEPPAPGERRATLRAGLALQRAPDGATLATLGGPAQVTVAESDREWVKVRMEGWVKRADLEGAVAPPAITAAMLRETPEKFVGQTVEWRLQFLAHQQADELRPEMPLGHPYLLARGPLPESGFVYVLVSKEQSEQLQGLKPLDELTITATVRAARTRYLATPVVELVRLGGGR